MKNGHIEDINNVVMPEDEDDYVRAEVNLPFGGTVQAGTVARTARLEEQRTVTT